MKTKTLINGVDVDLIKNTVGAIQADPEVAQFKFRLTNRWIDGGHNESRTGDFYGARQENSHESTFLIDSDEPKMLAGNDVAANPIEYYLTSLASCLTSALVYHAAVNGIEIEQVESELSGDIDLRGYLGISDDVRKGCHDIHVKIRVKTSEENLDKIRELAEFSPVLDLARHGTNVKLDLERIS